MAPNYWSYWFSKIVINQRDSALHKMCTPWKCKKHRFLRWKSQKAIKKKSSKKILSGLVIKLLIQFIFINIFCVIIANWFFQKKILLPDWLLGGLKKPWYKIINNRLLAEEAIHKNYLFIFILTKKMVSHRWLNFNLTTLFRQPANKVNSM